MLSKSERLKQEHSSTPEQRTWCVIEMGSLLVLCRQSSEASGVYPQRKVSGSLQCTSEVTPTHAYILTYMCAHISIHPSINDVLRVNLLRFTAVWEALGEVLAGEAGSVLRELTVQCGRMMVNPHTRNTASVKQEFPPPQMVREQRVWRKKPSHMVLLERSTAINFLEDNLREKSLIFGSPSGPENSSI